MSANDTTNVFELKDVAFDYPSGEMALQGINMTIGKGERIALLGANGSGKSTLLKLLNGLMLVKSGELLAFGEKLTAENLSNEDFAFGFHRRIGFVFQNSDAQLFNTNVWEEIAFGPMQLGLPKDEINRIVKSMVDLLNLENLVKRPPFRLSGGEKKLVALASVLALDPDVLLFDEPTNGLDPRTQRKLIHMIQHLCSSGKTVITATHNLEIVTEIADRAMVFNEEHRLVANGLCGDILKDSALLASVNLIDEDFHVHSHDGTTVLHAHDERK